MKFKLTKFKLMKFKLRHSFSPTSFHGLVLWAGLLMASALRAQAPATELGSLADVPYRIDIPANWNHSLVVYYHGYSEKPFVYAPGPINAAIKPFLDKGFAIIQSGYSQTGWALEQAFPETEDLRNFFIAHHGQPRETFVSGHSMGGALTMMTIEQRPDVYAGALALCGRLGSMDVASQQRFSWRAAFDFYFPGLMPPLVPTPPDYVETPELRAKVAAALQSNPAAAAAMRNLTGLRTDAALTHMMVYATYVIGDLQRKSGGNPFDNRDLIYSGTAGVDPIGGDSTPVTSASDNALNDGVRRYAADPYALQYLLRNYTPTGKLLRPMLALHTTYDPIIPVATVTTYAEQIEAAGFGDHFVQQYVRHDGHCAMTPEETGRAFDELLDWVHNGRQPTPGLLK